MITEPCNPRESKLERTVGSGLYVDVENLRADGQRLIKSLLDNWPAVAPAPTRLCLFVRADLEELWRLWANHIFQGETVDVRGIQHFSTYSSKNSADIAIATTSIADLLLGRINHVVVLSDDSDFMSLYATIRDEWSKSRSEMSKVPFLWVVTDRDDTVSSTVKQFFPPQQLHVIALGAATGQGSELATVTRSDAKPEGSTYSQDVWHEIAQAIQNQVPVGKFKSTDCQGIIRKYWPNHPLAGASGPAFGLEFQKSIFPILQERGVKIANPGKKPIRYEMTQRAKKER